MGPAVPRRLVGARPLPFAAGSATLGDPCSRWKQNLRSRATSRTPALVVAVVAALSLVPLELQAHEVLRSAEGYALHFEAWPVPVYLISSDADDLLLVNQESILLSTIATWNEASPVGALLRYGGLTPRWPGYGITIRLDDGFEQAGTEFLGKLQVRRGAKGALRRVEVSVNSSYFDYSGAAFTAPGKVPFDLQVAMTHLLGHALGIGHSRDSTAAMFFLPSSLSFRQPTSDDKAALALLYGGKPQGGLCDACGADADCATGMCLAWPSGASWCASTCSSHDDCPIGWSCGSWKGGLACLPNEGTCGPDSTQSWIGDRCWSDGGCASKFCQTDGGSGFCTSACPCSAGSCAASAIGSICVQRGSRAKYEPCWNGRDCNTGFCVAGTDGGWCATPCAAGCQATERCEGDWCVPASGPGQLAVGWPCETALDCASGKCEALGGRFAQTCTQECALSTDCPSGTGCSTSATTSRCVATPTAPWALGQPCSAAGTCGQTRYCDLSVRVAGFGVCRAKCDPFVETATCGSGERCVSLADGSGVCEPALGGLGTPGSACSSTSPCRADLVCAGPVGGQGICRYDCLIDDKSGCASGEFCLPTATGATVGACSTDEEPLQSWPAPAPKATNWAAVELDTLDIVAVDAFVHPEEPANSAEGCTASRASRPSGGLFGMLVALAALHLRRRRTGSAPG